VLGDGRPSLGTDGGVQRRRGTASRCRYITVPRLFVYIEHFIEEGVE
jgi:hypothetical protein